MSNRGLEVYVYKGYGGEEVPRSVQHLIVKDGVRVCPERLCYEYERLRKVTFPNGLTDIDDGSFSSCSNLLEINKIPNSVQVIGEWAFRYCGNLKKIEFEDPNGTSPHQLRTIYQRAFEGCESLERVKLTSSVLHIVGERAFADCNALVEANLSATRLTEIQDCVFSYCNWLLTVGLPNTITRIGAGAFYKCSALVTVVVPLDSQSIMIEKASFAGCASLANIPLPQGSTVGGYSSGFEPFRGCTVLHARFGEDTTTIVAGLISRIDAYPIHKMCYDDARVTVQELRLCLSDHQEGNAVVDEFGMTPLHVYFSTPEPSLELLEVLLESQQYQVLCKDVNNRRPLDYLVTNWTDSNASLFQITVQKWVIDRLARWSAMSWMEAMQSKVQEILSEQDKARRSALSDELLSVFEHYSNVEATSILELALWKVNLRSSGSEVVVPNVFKFLSIAPQAPTTRAD